ncbi:O-antigen ligase family protein [Oscillatoria amoena NRMC-F 0135]|nr:O-antigen ligase family protein [Oscillatoria laete-virens]MDL5047215.1 O-antigen ligase family protein [Oscillatoria amoena NRMC-F 0135]MDL5052556.1 O-antigen ligase family protein [Oscillatoria laete-virens NRMC-F 0139]
MTQNTQWLIRVWIMLIFAFLPWAFGTVEPWSIYGVLVAIALGVIGTVLLSGRHALKHMTGLFVYLGILWALFGWTLMNPMELDVFALHAQGKIIHRESIEWLPASLVPWRSLDKLLLWSGCGAFAWLVSHHFRDRKALRVLIIFLLANATFLILVAILQKVTDAQKILWFRPITFFWDPNLPMPFVGPFVNRNHFAAYINLIWPLAFPLYVILLKRHRKNEVKRKDSIILLFILLGIMVSGIFLSASRGGALTASLMVLISLCLFPRILLRLPWYYWVAALIGIGLLLGFFGEGLLERVLKSFGQDHHRIGHDGRWLIWKDCPQIIAASPVFGWGPGCFRTIFAFFKDPVILYRIEYAHNDYIETLVESGVMGAVFWALVLIVVSIIVVRGILRLQSRFRSALAKAAVLSLVGMLIHAGLDFPFQMGGLSLTFAGLLGISLGAIHSSSIKIDESEEAT